MDYVTEENAIIFNYVFYKGIIKNQFFLILHILIKN